MERVEPQQPSQFRKPGIDSSTEATFERRFDRAGEAERIEGFREPDVKRTRRQPIALVAWRRDDAHLRGERDEPCGDQTDAAVTDNSLAQCLAEIRRALDDDSQRVIRTVSRRGYLFAAPVTTSPAKFPRSSSEAAELHAAFPGAPNPPAASSRHWKAAAGVVVVLAIGVGGFLSLRSAPGSRGGLTYEQLTDFTDSAVAPAVSPDGRILAFVRGAKWFGGTDQIHVKILPNGEAIQLTHDPLQKYGLAFSADGSRIAYTVWGRGGRWETFAISPLGGEPSLLLANAAGLTWLDQHRLLFAELKSGMHMGHRDRDGEPLGTPRGVLPGA